MQHQLLLRDLSLFPSLLALHDHAWMLQISKRPKGCWGCLWLEDFYHMASWLSTVCGASLHFHFWVSTDVCLPPVSRLVVLFHLSCTYLNPASSPHTLDWWGRSSAQWHFESLNKLWFVAVWWQIRCPLFGSCMQQSQKFIFKFAVDWRSWNCDSQRAFFFQ